MLRPDLILAPRELALPSGRLLGLQDARLLPLAQERRRPLEVAIGDGPGDLGIGEPGAAPIVGHGRLEVREVLRRLVEAAGVERLVEAAGEHAGDALQAVAGLA